MRELHVVRTGWTCSSFPPGTGHRGGCQNHSAAGSAMGQLLRLGYTQDISPSLSPCRTLGSPGCVIHN